jgi:hypothetical protein
MLKENKIKYLFIIKMPLFSTYWGKFVTQELYKKFKMEGMERFSFSSHISKTVTPPLLNDQFLCKHKN